MMPGTQNKPSFNMLTYEAFMEHNKTFIIAEAGVNHNCNIDTAKKLIDAASGAHCDAVKFQTFKAKNLTSKQAKKCSYQIENTHNNDSQFDMIKCLELPYEWHMELYDYSEKKGMLFLSTPFDIESAEFLNELGIKVYKVPSGEINNVPYLEKINSFKKPVILSTGMATMDEIKFAVSILHSCNISVLHCNTQYPTPFEDANLRAMEHIKNETGLKTGYSDHTMGIEAAIAAVAMGAKIIEKHITLDKAMEGPDHRASIEPHELAAMVLAIRNIEKALGDGIKKPSPSESLNIDNVRKSIVAKKTIKKGEIFSNDNITVKRPATGISPSKWYEVIGEMAHRDYEEDDLIE